MESKPLIREKFWFFIIAVVSVLVVGLVVLLILRAEQIDQFHPDIYILPKLNAILNSATFVMLLAGFFFIMKKNIRYHQYCMVTALTLSVFFLVSYIIYHSNAPSTKFEGEGTIRAVYFFLLLTHIVLAAVVVPLALLTIFRIWNLQILQHKKIARWTLPIWLYVSATGIIVYLMIKPYYPV
ncbi:MAG: DUF420 domain-containing protein [Bacteroidia bacterium]